MALVAGDLNDLATMTTGYDAIQGRNVGYFSQAWWESVGWTVVPFGSAAAFGVLKSLDDLPRGFSNLSHFQEFGTSLYEGLRHAGYEDAVAIFQGSAVTGVKYKTEVPFDVGRVSDFDIALASPTLFQRAQELGIPLRGNGTRTRPLTENDLENLGLYDLATQLGGDANRPVNFMIYGSADDAIQRAPSIVVP